MEQRIKELEERICYLEKHIGELEKKLANEVHYHYTYQVPSINQPQYPMVNPMMLFGYPPDDQHEE